MESYIQKQIEEKNSFCTLHNLDMEAEKYCGCFVIRVGTLFMVAVPMKVAWLDYLEWTM
jgi:hypothetical protein